MKHQAAQANAQRASQLAHAAAAAASSGDSSQNDGDSRMHDANADVKPSIVDSPQKPSDPRLASGAAFPNRQAWDYVEEVMQILKTAFPLLIMNMETVVEQIIMRFKGSREEDIYRFICMLRQDAMQVRHKSGV